MKLFATALKSFLVWLLFLGAVHARSELTFDASARPTSLILGGQELLESKSPGGFMLQAPDGLKTRLDTINVSNNVVRVSAHGGKPQFTFQVDHYPRHLVIHLMGMEGVGNGLDYKLSLQLDSDDIAAYTLNDLMMENARNKRRKYVELSWPYLWGRARPDGSRGSVVLYDGRLSGQELDAVLAEIWSTQAAAGRMVKPAVESWTESDVLAWVDRWVEKFRTIAVMSVHPEKSEDELYKMTDEYVIPSGANRVYMMSTSWRQSGMTTPREAIFPEGTADMIAYSKYLEDRGIQLHLKSLAPQIRDGKYLSSDFVDPRLMRWCAGYLEEAVDASSTTLRFRLGPSVIVKMKELEYIRLGHEVVKVNRLTKLEDLWILEDCERGSQNTAAKLHAAGTEIAGLVISNNSFNFEDDFGMPNSLAEEICGAYGDFLNEINVSHLHFDGTGRMLEPPWYARDFTDYVYSRVGHPTTGSVVGGGGLPANFEMKFSKTQEIMGMLNYWILRIGPRLHQKGRKHIESATSQLELHFDVANGILRGSRRLFFCGGQSGSKLSLETLNDYGLTEHCLELFSYWKELAPVYADADVEYLRSFMKGRGNHYTGPVSAVLSKDGNGDYIYTPHHIMGRSSGEDELIIIDQEWGAKARWQSIQAGTALELENPYEAQEPKLTIFVMDDSAALKDPVITVNQNSKLAVKGEIQPTEYMQFEGGSSVTIYDKNWNRLHTLPAKTQLFTINKGTSAVTIEAASIADLKVQFITLGPPYVLESNQHLTGAVEQLEGITYQAEAMQLQGYQVGRRSAAFGGQCVATRNRGIATQQFTGEAGSYTIAIYYFDESDGQSSYALRVDDKTVDTWIANSSTGTSEMDQISKALRKVEGVALNDGSIIEIGSVVNGGEYGSLDKIVLIAE